MTCVSNMLISSHMEMFKSKLFHFVVLGSPGLPSTAMISFSSSNSRVTMWLPTTDHSNTFFIRASIFSLRRIGLSSSPLSIEGNAFILEHLLFHPGELVSNWLLAHHPLLVERVGPLIRWKSYHGNPSSPTVLSEEPLLVLSPLLLTLDLQLIE